MKILLIEDSSLIRETVARLLQAQGHETLEAENGVMGLKIARNQKPDLILCDVVMPGLTGHDVLRALRYSPKTSAIPFVFLSGLAPTEEHNELGANGYIAKPFTQKQLLNTISQAISLN